MIAEKIYENLERLIRQAIDLDDDDRTILILDTISNYLPLEHLEYQPVIAIGSAQAGTGKSKALKLIHKLNENSHLTSDATPAALRRLSQKRSIICWDEADKEIWESGGRSSSHKLIKMCFDRNSVQDRCEPTGVGGYQQKSYKVCCKLYFANVINTSSYEPDSEIMSRIIQIIMKPSTLICDGEESYEGLITKVKDELSSLSNSITSDGMREATDSVRQKLIGKFDSAREKDKYLPILIASHFCNRFDGALSTLLSQEDRVYDLNQIDNVDIFNRVISHCNEHDQKIIKGEDLVQLFRNTKFSSRFSSPRKTKETMRIMGVKYVNNGGKRGYETKNIVLCLKKCCKC